MKKILLSLAIILVVGGVAWGATRSFYNDTETSNGNIFVAGSIDLKVDHTKQTYNGVDCKTCSVTLVSDTTNQVVSTTGGSDSGFPHAAVVVTPTAITNQYWTADVDGAVNDARWIWATDPVTQNDSDNTVTYTFQKTFTWFGPTTGATLNLGIGADNNYSVILNGNPEGSASGSFATADTINILATHIVQGTNTLQIQVTNFAQPSQPLLNNPAGLLYKLVINGNCGDAYFQNHCQLWQSTDLTTQKFFDFGDVKPGDQGTDVISLSVTSNDAFACLLLDNKKDNEKTLVDPEVTAGDITPGSPAGTDGGELSNYLNVVVWDDNNDGVHQPAELILYNGLLKNLVPLSLSLPTSITDYLGLAWCAGTQTVAGDGSISCNGSGNQNDAQTDSFVSDIVAYAVQQRNNPNFTCASVVLP